MDMEVISSKAQENRFIYMSGYPALFSFTPGRDIMTQDMTKGKIMPMLIRFTIPLVLGNLFQLTYNAVDSIIVGHFIGKEALAAVGICNPVTTLVILFLNGLCMGASILIGTYYGAKDYSLTPDQYDYDFRICIFCNSNHSQYWNCEITSQIATGRRIYFGYDDFLPSHHICRTYVYIFI